MSEASGTRAGGQRQAGDMSEESSVIEEDRGSAEARRRKPRDKPLVIVLTGTGKGKSSSAFGMLMRSWARGYRCGVFQFVKSGKWKVGEAKAAAALGGIDWEKMGDGWSWLSKDLDESADMARAGWQGVKEAIAEERYEFLDRKSVV